MAIANIVLTDGQGTPVNHTFVPVADGDNARWVNASTALIVLGQETLGVNFERKADGASKVRLTLWDPTEVTVNGVTTVDHGNSVTTNFSFAPSATVQEKLDLIKMNADLQAEAVIQNAVKDHIPFL